VSAVPQIRRASYNPDEIFRTNAPIPVIASIRWSAGKSWGPPQDVEARVLAWTLTAVEIEWKHDNDTHVDWIDAQDVRRRRSGAPAHTTDR
jgi:hypothetical protein